MSTDERSHREFYPSDWPHGLRCMDCQQTFEPGDTIAERLVSMDYTEGGEPAFVVDLICVPCSLKAIS